MCSAAVICSNGKFLIKDIKLCRSVIFIQLKLKGRAFFYVSFLFTCLVVICVYVCKGKIKLLVTCIFADIRLVRTLVDYEGIPCVIFFCRIMVSGCIPCAYAEDNCLVQVLFFRRIYDYCLSGCFCDYSFIKYRSVFCI